MGLDPSLGPVLPALLALLNVPVDEPAWAALDPPRRRRQTLDALERLLLRASHDRLLLLVFEDLHWIDSETQALLDEIVERLPATSTVLLVSYRPEYQHEWGSKSWYTQIRVNPLPEDGAAELLGALLGTDPTLRPLEALLTARTAGNPFFLEESVRALVETGALTGEHGAYRLARPIEDVRVPATVQAVLAARIDRLSPRDKRLLQTAAVIGTYLSLALLRATAELPDEELQSGLARLQAAELLFPARLFPEPEYTFKHALTHEVAYGSLLQDRRKALHARIVEAIERLYLDRLDEHVERLAHHALRAERWEQAARYCRQAGRRALMRSVTHEAVAWFEPGLVALRRLPERRDVLEQVIDLSVDLRSALNGIGELERAFTFLAEAERYAEQIGDQRRLGRVLVSMNSYLAFGNNLERAFTVSRRALTLGTTVDDLLLQAAAHQNLGQDHHTVGDYRAAIGHFRQAIECLDRETSARPELLGSSALLPQHARSCLAWSMAELGDFDEALEYGHDSVRVADGLGHLVSRMSSLLYLAMVYVRKAEYQQAVSLLESALDLMDTANLRANTSFNGIAGSLGAAYVQVGRVTDAVPLLEQGRAQSLAQGAISDFFICAPPLVEAYLTVGRHDAAVDVAREAVELASEQGKRGFLGWAVHALAEVEAHRDQADPAAAEAAYRQALALAEELGMRPLQAHCHLGLGKVYRRIGRVEDARAELSRAVEMFREMDMTHWLPEAERELAAATGAVPAPPPG